MHLSSHQTPSLHGPLPTAMQVCAAAVVDTGLPSARTCSNALHDVVIVSAVRTPMCKVSELSVTSFRLLARVAGRAVDGVACMRFGVAASGGSGWAGGLPGVPAGLLWQLATGPSSLQLQTVPLLSGLQRQATLITPCHPPE